MGVSLEVSVLASGSVIHSCPCCQGVTQWSLYALGHVGLGPVRTSAHRDGSWLLTKHPQGPLVRKASITILNTAHLKQSLVAAPTSEHH